MVSMVAARGQEGRSADEARSRMGSEWEGVDRKSRWDLQKRWGGAMSVSLHDKKDPDS